MISSAILESIRQSFFRNGLTKTVSLVIQYLRMKGRSSGVFKLRFDKNLSNILLRINTSDFSTFRQVFMNDEYGFELPETPGVIVDAGANIGLASLYFAQRFPNAKIFALEPDDSNYEMLASNVRQYPQITSLKTALWKTKTTLEIVDHGYDKWGLQVQEANGNTKNAVNAIDVCSLMEANHLTQIDLLKIDIEGAELELFQNNFQQWLPRVKMIVIELHDHLRPGCSDVFNKAIDTIHHTKTFKGENIVIYNLGLK
jgi:FkbM family methyltransferase